MLLQKDKLSNFDFLPVKEFILALFFMFLSTIVSFLCVPFLLVRTFPVYATFIKSNYFAVIIFIFSTFLTLYVIYYFICKRKNKTIQEGFFLYNKSTKTHLISLLIGVLMPLLSLPIIFKFLPSEFYAMDIIKKEGGLFYIFASALFAPVSEEIFYRGFIFPFFQSKLNSFWAIIITSIFFGLAHFMNIGNALILISLFIFYGFVLSLIRYFTNSLIPPMITHFVHNVTLIVSFLVVSKIL